MLILTVLAIISTDGWQRRLKRNWKRLNLLVYPAAVLALVHFFLQSKINVGEATFAAGLFAWLMLWRLFPSKLRTTYPGLLLLLAVAAALAALGFELGWYGLLISYAASSTLAKQIEEGAPADIFISADEDWMNYLADKKLIDEATRIDLLGNDLVLIAPKDSTTSTEIVPPSRSINCSATASSP